MKDPADKKKWIVDEEAAEIVKRIFDLCIAGKGPMQIAKLLTAEHILTVKHIMPSVPENRCLKNHITGTRNLWRGSWNGQSTPVAR